MAVGDIRFPAEGQGPRTATRFDIEGVQKEFARYNEQRNRLGDAMYTGAGWGAVQIVAPAQGLNSAGVVLLFNPSASGKIALLKRVAVMTFRTSSNVRLTSPRFAVEKFTDASNIQGVPQYVPDRLRQSAPPSAMYVTDNNTGLSANNIETIFCFYPVMQLTSTIRHGEHSSIWSTNFDEEEAPIIEPGEGIRFGRQIDAGDATDGGRQVNVRMWWNEFSEEF